MTYNKVIIEMETAILIKLPWNIFEIKKTPWFIIYK